MTEYVHVGKHADILASGRGIGPSDRVKDTDLSGDGHDQHLLDEGVLVDVASFGSPQDHLPSKAELQKRAGELNIEGRSQMGVEDLRAAVVAAETEPVGSIPGKGLIANG